MGLCPALGRGAGWICWSWVGKAALATGLLTQLSRTAGERVQDGLAGSGEGTEAASLSVCLL